jgi:hypothetical protein
LERGLVLKTFWREQFAATIPEIFMTTWRPGFLWRTPRRAGCGNHLCRGKRFPLAHDHALRRVLPRFVFAASLLAQRLLLRRECSLPWAIRYPYGHDSTAPVHPNQIYDSLLNLIFTLAWPG